MTPHGDIIKAESHRVAHQAALLALALGANVLDSGRPGACASSSSSSRGSSALVDGASRLLVVPLVAGVGV